jgi:hypothetical protein
VVFKVLNPRVLLSVPVAGVAPTVTVVEAEAEPPAPVQLSTYVAVALGVTVPVPEVAFVPLQPPEAVQEVASVELQVSALPLPAATVVGEALRETVGVGVTVGLGP